MFIFVGWLKRNFMKSIFLHFVNDYDCWRLYQQVKKANIDDIEEIIKKVIIR